MKNRLLLCFIETVKPYWKRFSFWFSLNIILYFLLLCIIHKKDPGIYITTTILSLFTLSLWSCYQSMLVCEHHIYIHHLICLFLPYSLILGDVLNSQIKNMAYFLSQIFVYFSIGCICLSIDLIFRASIMTKCLYGKIVAGIWNLICSLFFLFFLLLSINSLLGNISFDYDAMIAVCQTNFKEAIGYFSRLNHRYILLGVTLLIATFLLLLNIPFKYNKQYVRLSKSISCVIIALVTFVASSFVFSNKLYFSNVFKLISAPITYYQQNRNFKEERSNYEIFVKRNFIHEPVNPHSQGAFVIIIGESLNRHYMSIYGYSKESTKYQREIIERDTCFLFKHPFSAYAQTIRCISYMLTDQNQYNNQKKTLQNSISLFDIARHNHYMTRWYSAQGTNLFLDSPTAVLASSADYSFSLPTIRSQFDHKITDMDLLSFLPEKLTNKELIVIQLMGSHYPYQNNYPETFMSNTSLSSYEKSVYYNDLVIKRLFDFFHERNASAILYISDHSEDIATGRGHDPRLEVFTQTMTEIPFWLYVSPEYASNHPMLLGQLKRASTRVFTSDLLFDLVISLMDIHSTFTDSRNDILSDDYVLNEDNARTLGGKVKLNIQTGVNHNNGLLP